MFEDEIEGDKAVGSPTGREAHSTEEQPAARPRRKQRGPKPQAPNGPETAIILVNTADMTCEILSEDDLLTTGARVISDKKLTLYRATPLEPRITFDDTAQA
jgi:hypothetical protein